MENRKDIDAIKRRRDREGGRERDGEKSVSSIPLSN